MTHCQEQNWTKPNFSQCEFMKLIYKGEEIYFFFQMKPREHNKVTCNITVPEK